MDHSPAPKSFASPSRRFGFLIALLAGLLLAGSAAAQVDVTATAGTPNASYTTLGAAFTAINAGTHQGDITIGISASTTEGTTPATLNSNGAGTALYTSVLIQPTVDGVSISGNPVTGFGVIQLNGADNVTIDGDNPNTAGTNRNLTVANTTTATVIANSAIRIATSAAVTSADNITIKNCILTGNVTGGNASSITSTTGSSNSSFGIYAGGNGGATATGAPTAITSVTSNTAPSGTTINNLLIDNNTVNACARAIVFNGAATTVSTGVTITNNVVGDQGTPSPATPPYTSPATTVYTKGIWIAGANAVTVTGNTLTNVMSYVGTTSTNIELASAIGPSVTISNNTITNPTQNGTSSAVKPIQISSATGTYTVSGNLISNVQAMSSSSGTAGIEAGGTATSGTIELNRITTVYNRNAGTYGATGLHVTAGTNITVRNNFISDVRMNMTGGGAFSTTFGVYGLKISGGTAHKVYHNSVNLFGPLLGTSTTSILTSAFVVVGTGQTGLDVRNNAFANTLTGGTTSVAHVAIYLPSAGTSAMNLTLNNNGYYFGTDPARQGVGQAGTTAGTNFYTTLAALQAYSSTLSGAATNDNASFASTAPAPFTSTTDLHVPAATVTQLESSGAAVGVTTDIDGDVRNATTPDVGADEFAGVSPPANDIAATAIVVPATGSVVANGSTATPQASFQNVGTATQTNVSVQFTMTGPGGYNYTDPQTIATINPGETVTVTFTAAPAFSATGIYNTAAAVLTPDATPANDQVTGSFEVKNPVAGGTYNVPGDFPSLTNPGGIFSELNALGATGNVTVNIAADLTAETGTFALNELAGGFTVTIRPTGTARTISGTSVGSGLIKLNGADGVTIDGSLSGGTDRSLTITNSNAAGIVIWIASASAANGASNNTVKNCVLSGNSGTTTIAGVLSGSGTTLGGDAEAPNSNNTLQNNLVVRVQNAAYLRGNATLYDQNWLVTGNTFGSTVAADKLGFRGMLIGNAQAFSISRNTITGVFSSPTTTATMNGIRVALAIAGGSIHGNAISDIKQNNTGGYGAGGISLAATTTASAVNVYNNMIWDVAGQGFAGTTEADNGYGLVVASGGGYNIWANTISLSTNQVAAGSITSAVHILAAVTTAGSIDLRDNVLSNAETVGTRYGVYCLAAASVFSSINYNDYFAQNVGFLGSAQATLAGWQTATGQDANSLAVDPLLVSATDLHLQAASTLRAAGTPLATVTVDFDNEARSATTPDIGADEYVPVDLSITKTDGVTQAAPGGSVTYTITATNAGPVGTTATVADTFPAECGAVSWTCSGSGGGTCSASGVGNIGDAASLPVGGSVTYLAACSISGTASGSLVNTTTVTGAVSDPNPADNSATDTDTLVASSDLSITKTDGVAFVSPGGNTTYTIAASNAGPSPTTATVADTFPAALTCTWTCLGSGGGTCAASGSGNINDATVSLPGGGSVVYTAACAVSPAASGTIANTATVTGVAADPTPADNSATDTDTVAPAAPATSGVREAEPNGTFGTANALGGRNVRVYANVYPNADVDWFSFTAAVGDKVYAATMTNFNASGSTDSVLDLYASDGTTVIETDDNDGSLGASASTIAAATLPSAGTYYLRVRHLSATSQLRPYELWVRLQSASEAPTPETEPNDLPTTATPAPPNGWVSGTHDTTTDVDWFWFTANAGDTVTLVLDADPERDAVQWDGRLGLFGAFGDAGNMILVVNDASVGSAANPLSEAIFLTVKSSGTYFAYIDSTGATAGPAATYTLSVSVHPAVDEGLNCTTYTSTDVPQTIGPGAGLVSSTITVPGNPRIADIDVSLQLTHALMADIDAHLRSPQGNDNALFTDTGATAAGGQAQMDATFDDEAASQPSYTVLKGLNWKPEYLYRLSWFDGEDAGGTWTLDLRDDGANTSGGTLTGWSIRICEPAPAPACPPGTSPVTVYTSDFEANDGGFTHSGTADDWARGLPSAVPITTCNSGSNCWKTNLAGTYSASSDQNLLSPAIDLSTAGLVGPVLATWHQRYQLESASFDHAYVDAQDVSAGATPQRLWEWLDATMTNNVGNPTVTIQESAGWGRRTSDVSAFLGQNDFQLRFHLDTDSSGQYGGLAVDDVTVTACLAPGADLSITKDDGLATATPGTSTTYTITASNAGPQAVTGATVADTFPAACTSVSWTCSGTGGGTCAASGSGSINDASVNLPVGGSVTYSATCNIASSATGTLSNTATVSSSTTDPVPGNNSATDSDTLTPSADLVLIDSDSADPVGVHRPVTYTLTIHNNGWSDATSVVLTDNLNASTLFVSSVPGSPTCTHAAGVVTCNLGTLAAQGDAIVSVTAQTTATGTFFNTANVTSSVTDPTPSNNNAGEQTTVVFRKGDYDNDLQTDLYIGNTVAPDHRLWLMNGVTRLGELTFSPAPATLNQQISGVDDFNGDSWNDLVLWNNATGAVEFWLMNGTSATRPGAAVPLSGGPTLATNWKLSATADFNADAKPDIVWRNFTSQKIVIWTMNGTAKVGNIIPSPDQAVDFNWEIVGAFDMNNDGATDFLWYNSTSGKIVYWWMNASVVRIAGAFTNPANAGDNNWKVLAAGDYGVGTGGVANTKDIVWRNATSGNFVVWYMNFAGARTFGEFTSPTNPSPNPTDWTIVGPR